MPPMTIVTDAPLRRRLKCRSLGGGGGLPKCCWSGQSIVAGLVKAMLLVKAVLLVSVVGLIRAMLLVKAVLLV